LADAAIAGYVAMSRLRQPAFHGDVIFGGALGSPAAGRSSDATGDRTSRCADVPGGFMISQPQSVAAAR
jgi:hypothetical protein